MYSETERATHKDTLRRYTRIVRLLGELEFALRELRGYDLKYLEERGSHLREAFERLEHFAQEAKQAKYLLEDFIRDLARSLIA